MTSVTYAAGKTKELMRVAERKAYEKTADLAVNPVKAKRVLRIASFVAVLATMLLSVVTAAGSSAGDQIEDGIKTGAERVWGIVIAVVLPLGAVAIAVCFLWVLFDGERGMEKGKKYRIRVLIVVAVVFLAPLILQQVGGWFKDSSIWPDNWGL